MSSIQRFIEKISQQQDSILDEIENASQKTGHWIWWAFPQQVPLELWGHVSTTTRHYSTTMEEVAMLVNDPLFSTFYRKAIQLLLTKKSLRLFFGPDIMKFKSHLVLFNLVCNTVNETSLTVAINTLLEKIDTK